MPRRPRFALLLSIGLIAILSLALAACGNDDDDNGAPLDDANDTPTDVDDDDAAPPPDDANGDDDIDVNGNDVDGNDVNGNDDDMADALRRAAGADRDRSISILYEFEWEEGEVMQWRIDSDPPRHAMRIEGDMGDGVEGLLISIYDGEDSYFCMDDDGGVCMKFEGSEDDFMDEFFFFDQEELLREIAEEEGAQIRPASGRSFAGISADCFDVSTADGEGVVCVSTEHNIMLFVEGTFEGEYSRIEAIEFSDQPAPNAFEPPFPVMDLGDFDDFD